MPSASSVLCPPPSAPSLLMGPRLYAYEGLPELWRGRGQAVPSDLKRCAEVEMEEETVLSCLPKLNRDLISQD